MSDVFFDKFIADLVKGAELNSRANGGPGVNVLISRDNTGHEEKLAGLGGGLGALLSPLGAAAGAGLQDRDVGSAAGAGIGSLVGGLAGVPIGMLGGGMVGVPIGALVNLLQGENIGDGARAGGAIGAGIGSIAGAPLGAVLGGHAGQNHFRSDNDKEKRADLVKGAELNSRANGGPGVNIDIARGDNAREEKLASVPGVIGGGLLGGLGGTLGGSLAGAGAGALLGRLTGMSPNEAHELSALLGMGGGAVGGAGGMMAGGAAGKDDPSMLQRLKGGALEARYLEGAKQAAAALGIKEAFLPMLGAIAGPTLARAGLGALGRGVAGKALGGIAGKVAPRIAGGLGGAAFDQAASMAGGALGQKMQQPPQPQGMMG